MRRRAFHAGETGVQSRVSVVIPAYYEESTIRKVILATRGLFPDVMVVDDHSTDHTGAIARQSGATVFASPDGRGPGLATLHGVKASKKPVVVTLDADGQHSPGDIPRMLGPILDGEADFVVGRRARLPPSEAPVRKVVHAILGRNLDVGSGLRAFKRGYV